ncbi:MAG: hypothetical protein RID53_20300 [Coleofasciculus sp. B1-GNL1-01]
MSASCYVVSTILPCGNVRSAIAESSEAEAAYNEFNRVFRSWCAKLL